MNKDPYTPLVSVIIPTYNRAYCLKSAILSVLNQTYYNLECIIIDNNSLDNTDEIISNLNDDRIKYKKISNKGIIAKSRNEGIRLSQGEIIAFLDSDDLWNKYKIEKCIQLFKCKYDLVYHSIELRKKTTNSKSIIASRIKAIDYKNGYFKWFLRRGNNIALSSVIVKKSVLENIGLFSEEKSLLGASDCFCWLNIALHGGRFKGLKDTLGTNFISQDCVTSSIITDVYINYIYDFLYKNGYIKSPQLPMWSVWQISILLYREGKVTQCINNLKKLFITKIDIFYTTKSIIVLILLISLNFIKRMRKILTNK